MNIDARKAVVKPNVEMFEKAKSYANVANNITFKTKMKVFKGDLIDNDWRVICFLMPPHTTEGDQEVHIWVVYYSNFLTYCDMQIMYLLLSLYPIDRNRQLGRIQMGSAID